MEENMEIQTSEPESSIGDLSNGNEAVDAHDTQSESEPGNPNGLQSAQCVDVSFNRDEANHTLCLQKMEHLKDVHAKEKQALIAECNIKLQHTHHDFGAEITKLQRCYDDVLDEKEKLTLRLKAADQHAEDLKETHGTIVNTHAAHFYEEQEKSRKLEEENQCLKQQLQNKNTCSKSCLQKMEHLKDVHAKEKQALIAECNIKLQHTKHDFGAKITKLQRCYDDVLDEKEKLTLRLSKLASSNLTYNNPNIADLSDQNRPTKLAEKFSELYDNQWTDAFEDLDMEKEYVKVKCLADILKSVYNHCTTVSNQLSDNMWKTRDMFEIQYDKKPVIEVKSSEKVSNTVSTSDHKRAGIENQTQSEKPLAEIDNQTGHDVLQPGEYDEITLQGFVVCTPEDAVLAETAHSFNTSKIEGKSPDLSDNHKPAESKNKNINRGIQFEIEDKLSVDERKSIGDIKKLLLQRNKDEVLKKIAVAVADEFGITQRERIVTYIKECAYVCWEMRLHDPPVFLKILEVGDIDSIPFDGTAYRAYTRGGKLMEYVVWPPVSLHEKGPLLGKGVAQGK